MATDENGRSAEDIAAHWRCLFAEMQAQLTAAQQLRIVLADAMYLRNHGHGEVADELERLAHIEFGGAIGLKAD